MKVRYFLISIAAAAGFLRIVPRAFEPNTPTGLVICVALVFAWFCGAGAVLLFRLIDWLKQKMQ